MRRQSKTPTPFFDGVPSGAATGDQLKVVVVGAGAAGLSAARVLRSEGVEVVVRPIGATSERCSGRWWTWRRRSRRSSSTPTRSD